MPHKPIYDKQGDIENLKRWKRLFGADETEATPELVQSGGILRGTAPVVTAPAEAEEEEEEVLPARNITGKYSVPTYTGPKPSYMSDEEYEQFVARRRAEQQAAEAPTEAETTSRQSLEQAIADAKKEYSEAKDRNALLSVFQDLGNAITQYAAARKGLETGIDMSKLAFGPGVDYEKRTERARQEFKDKLDISDKAKQDLDRLIAARKKQIEEDTEFDIRRAERERETGKQQEFRLGMEQWEAEQEAAKFNIQQAMQEARQSYIDAREKGRSDTSARRESNKILDAQIRDTEKQLSQMQKQSQALGEASALYSKAPEMGSTKAQIQTARSAATKLAGSGLPEEERQEVEAAEKVPGTIYGTNADYANAAKKAAEKKQQLDARLQDLRNALDKLRASRGGGGTVSGTGAAAPAPAPGGYVRIQAPDGTIARVPVNEVEEYKARGGRVIP